MQESQHEIRRPTVCPAIFGTGPFGPRDGTILPDLCTQRRLGTVCSTALAG